MALEKIISGGQTGVDRAALDVAIELNIQHSGWCPKGRKAEDGVIDNKYQLKETSSNDYSERTIWNVRDADATLIILLNDPISGTLLTLDKAKKLNKPYLIVDLRQELSLDNIVTWIKEHNIKILNIAGPRESQAPGIYKLTKKMLYQLLAKVNTSSRT